MTAVRRRALPDRLEAALARCADVDAVARAVFDTVAADVAFAFACLATTDPASELITRAIKSDPLPLGDEEFAAAEYGAPDVNQFSEIARRPAPVGVLSVDTGGRPETCRRMRDYMTPTFGFTDELRLACQSRGTTWGVLALYRGAGQAPFTAADGAQLAAVHELVADHLKRVLFAAVADGGPGGGAAVLIVDGADKVTDVTAAAHQHIDELGGFDHGALPATLLAVAGRARTSAAPASARVRGRSGRWLALTALPLAGGSHRSVVLTVDAAPAAAVGQLTLAARGLTGREQDVAQAVLRGASTKAIAESLFLSPHTVQDHLKSIFVKLGVSSRREMIAELLAD